MTTEHRPNLPPKPASRTKVPRPSNGDAVKTVLRFRRPPSGNRLFANVAGVGRVKTRAYRAWRREASWTILTQPRHRHLGPVQVTYFLPRKFRPDQDNLLKACNDCLQFCGVILNDRLIEATHLHWHAGGDAEVVALIEDWRP